MQAKCLTTAESVYHGSMQTGRPSKKKRPPFGERLHSLRERAGLSQQQLAEKLGLTQRAYAYWERSPVALRPEQLAQLAEILGVELDELVYGSRKARRRGGPTGRAKQTFEKLSELSRSQQQKILDVVEAFVAQNNGA